jgi:hypothetical protein
MGSCSWEGIRDAVCVNSRIWRLHKRTSLRTESVWSTELHLYWVPRLLWAFFLSGSLLRRVMCAKWRLARPHMNCKTLGKLLSIPHFLRCKVECRCLPHRVSTRVVSQSIFCCHNWTPQAGWFLRIKVYLPHSSGSWEVQSHDATLCVAPSEALLAASQHGRGHQMVRESKCADLGFSSSLCKVTDASMGAFPPDLTEP